MVPALTCLWNTTATSDTLGWPAVPGSIQGAGTLVVSTQNVRLVAEKLNALCTSRCIRSSFVVAIEQVGWRWTLGSACMSTFLKKESKNALCSFCTNTKIWGPQSTWSKGTFYTCGNCTTPRGVRQTDPLLGADQFEWWMALVVHRHKLLLWAIYKHQISIHWFLWGCTHLVLDGRNYGDILWWEMKDKPTLNEIKVK